MNILLACGLGASTSLLVNKMRKAAENQGKDYKIEAVAKPQISSVASDYDVILIGPQITFALNSIKDQVAGKGIPVDVIKAQDYGMCDGEKVLAHAEKLYNDSKHN